ncbi:MAG: hypothetical protein JST07_10270 [Bacteroidetes bacterium]|nr:hypothetical protein [Bacteroidota bacterium]
MKKITKKVFLLSITLLLLTVQTFANPMALGKQVHLLAAKEQIYMFFTLQHPMYFGLR